MDNLVVHEDRMQANLDLMRGLVHSEGILLALVEKGLSRDEGYRMVQRNAMKVWNGEGTFEEVLKKDPDILTHLDEAEIGACFDDERTLANVDRIFQRVLG